MKTRRGGFLTIAISLLVSMMIVFGGVFAWLMWGQGDSSCAESFAALFERRDLKGTKAALAPQELCNMEINAAVTHSESGSYYNITINCGDVVLKNKTVLGDLIISENVGKGSVCLENIVVRGDILVKGGKTVTLNGVTAVELNTMANSTVDYLVLGESSIYQLNAKGSATIDERGLKRGYYGIKRVSGENKKALEKVILKFGTIEQTTEKAKK